MGFKPEHPGRRQRIYIDVVPPGFFIATVMDLTVVSATKRDDEFIAHFAAKGSRLRESQMMRIGRPPVANKAWPLSY